MKNEVLREIANCIKDAVEKEKECTRSASAYAVLDRVKERLKEDLKEYGLVLSDFERNITVETTDVSHIYYINIMDARGQSFRIGMWDDYREEMEYTTLTRKSKRI